jgi:hypothetical protein
MMVVKRGEADVIDTAHARGLAVFISRPSGGALLGAICARFFAHSAEEGSFAA